MRTRHCSSTEAAPAFVSFCRRLLSVAVLCAGLSGCTSPGYNDNPSQQPANVHVGCLAATEFFSVYFNVHLKPATEDPGQAVKPERFRSYCEELPGPGTVFFTADLVGPELSKVPIAVRVLEPEADAAEGNRSRRTVAQVAPVVYAKGVIETQFDLPANGTYTVELTRGTSPEPTEFDTLRIPLTVGVEPEAVVSAPKLLIAIALGLAMGWTVRWASRAKGRAG